jgi:hypothetical protein
MAIEEVDLAHWETQKINELTENSRLSEMKRPILRLGGTCARAENITINSLCQLAAVFKKPLSEIMGDAGL